MLTRDCPVGLSLARRARKRVAGAVSGAFVAALSAWAFVTRESAPIGVEATVLPPKAEQFIRRIAAPPEPRHTMGEIAPTIGTPEPITEVAGGISVPWAG